MAESTSEGSWAYWCMPPRNGSSSYSCLSISRVKYSRASGGSMCIYAFELSSITRRASERLVVEVLRSTLDAT